MLTHSRFSIAQLIILLSAKFLTLLSSLLQVLGTEELSSYLSKYRLDLDPRLEALVGRFISFLHGVSTLCLLAQVLSTINASLFVVAGIIENHGQSSLMLRTSIWQFPRYTKSCYLSSNKSFLPYHFCQTCTLYLYIVQAVDFLDKLLRYDHQERLTAKEAMVLQNLAT